MCEISSVRQPNGGSVTITSRSELANETFYNCGNHHIINILPGTCQELFKGRSIVKEVIIAHIVQTELFRTQIFGKSLIQIQQKTLQFVSQMEV